MGTFVNVFDTSHIVLASHPAQIWGEYLQDEDNWATDWAKKYHNFARDKGEQERLMQLTRKDRKHLIKKFDEEHVKVFDKDKDMCIPSFTGHPPARGPDIDMVSFGAIGANNLSATMPHKSAIAGRRGQRERGMPVVPRRGGPNPEMTLATTGGIPPPRRSRSCAPRVQAPTQATFQLYPTRYTKRNATMQWRDYVKASNKNNRMLNTQTTAMTMQGTTGYKTRSGPDPRHRVAGDYRGTNDDLRRSGPVDHYSQTPEEARHRAQGDFRAGEGREHGSHYYTDNAPERFHFGHEAAGRSEVMTDFQKLPTFMQQADI